MKKKIKIVLALLGIIIVIGAGILLINRPKYGLTPEDASKIYLQKVTSNYKMLDIISVQINGDTAK